MLADASRSRPACSPNFWWGSKLLDDSQRNGVTWDVGALASLTALTHVTITGRAYFAALERSALPGARCPTATSSTATRSDGDVRELPGVHRRHAPDRRAREDARQEADRPARDSWTSSGARTARGCLLSVIAEIAVDQHWNVFGILEGAPFQERARAVHEPVLGARCSIRTTTSTRGSASATSSRRSGAGARRRGSGRHRRARGRQAVRRARARGRARAARRRERAQQLEVALAGDVEAADQAGDDARAGRRRRARASRRRRRRAPPRRPRARARRWCRRRSRGRRRRARRRSRRRCARGIS